ncbi:MurR/RpiR family transcriptional regulator [Mycoplasma yeatsii]|uniref:MurR/RpiR family transcriptional regulator n=1 Tax=Mycoplasma yeatsii TaxID=51365 RepID=UPI0005B24EB3|nr:MurR/RpiR family transcriptional regulator [Mycoplasma yeatsii]AJM72213.1 RpiR family transcriptional regulator [Mycoplasma yeatsii GM274B]
MNVTNVIFRLKELAKEPETNIGLTSKTILDNMNLVANFNISKVAQITYTSPATITRFCQKYLNLSGFSELQTLIRVYLSEEQLNSDPKKHTKKNEFNYDEITSAINLTDSLIDMDEVDKIVEGIFKTKTVCIVSQDSSISYIASDLYEKMSLIGIPPIVIKQQETLEYYSKISDENWLFIVISHFGENAMVRKMIEQIHKNGSFVALVSMNNTSAFSKVADCWIKYAPTDQDPLQKIKYSSMFSLLYVTQVLFTSIVKKDKKRFEKISKILKIN